MKYSVGNFSAGAAVRHSIRAAAAVLFIAVISFFGLVVIYRLSKFGTSPQKVKELQPREIVDDESFHEKMTQLQKKGADTADIESDWNNLLSIRNKEAVTIALFGEINVGKSSLIKTLTGNDTEISARGGNTSVIAQYPVRLDQRSYELIDMPGLNEVGEHSVSQQLVKEKAVKSHVVVWVVDEEVTQSAHEHYRYLRQFNKPIIIAINKADYYSDSEQLAISERIQQQLEQRLPVVWVSSTREKTVEKHFEDGRIESHEVTVEGNIKELIMAVESLTFDRLTLDNRLNDSYFQSLELQMEQSLSQARAEKSTAIIKSYSQKAIFGGMAAVGPGTDVLLQGYLGMGMAKELCKLYEVDVKSVDLEGTLAMLNDKMRKELAVILALLGNVFKAFPGVGTVAGGAMHAVAYGLIFESVGKALVACLEKYHGIDQQYLSAEIEEQIRDNVETRAISMAKAVLFKK